MKLRRGFPVEAYEAQKRYGWCRSCADGRHRQCALHDNDHWEPGDHTSSCGCPCEGEVREGSPMINIVDQLRTELKRAHREKSQEVLEHGKLQTWATRVAGLVAVDIFNALYNDEEDFKPDRREVEQAMAQLDELFKASSIWEVRDMVSDEPEESDPEPMGDALGLAMFD